MQLNLAFLDAAQARETAPTLDAAARAAALEILARLIAKALEATPRQGESSDE